MKKHLKLIDGTSDKFWQIEAVNNSFTVTYGKNGTSGVSQTKTFDSEAQCLKEAEKILAEKIKKGYSEDGESGVVSISTKPKTEKQSDLQAILDEYDTLIKTSNLDGLLPFLKNHANGNREALKKHIKNSRKYWMEYTDLKDESHFLKARNDGYTWGIRGNHEQAQIITFTGVALFNLAEINPWNEVYNYFYELKHPYFGDILEWAKPDWVSAYLLPRERTSRWQNIPYDTLRILEDKGVLTYQPELFAIELAKQNTRDSQKANIEKLIQSIINDPITVHRDIPELFNYETFVEYMQIFHPRSEQIMEMINQWEFIFQVLIEDKKIDRIWFLENCLLIQTKEWRNSLKVYFRKCIEQFDPQTADLLKVQNTLFVLLHSPSGTIATFSIEFIKKIIEEKDFDTDAFLDWVEPVMMRTDCKGGLKTLMTMLEKLAQRQPVFKAKISSLLADVIMIPDLILQERVSKSILKIGDVSDVDLKEKLTMYAPEMLGQVSSILVDFLEKDAILEIFEANTSENYFFSPKKENVLREENRVVLPKDWNEILFQFGKFISSDEVLDAEILLNAFVTQRHLFPPDAKAQLQPYLKTLGRTYFDNGSKNIVKFYLQEKIVALDKYGITPAQSYRDTNVISILYELIAKIERKAVTGSTLPLLSFPTHAPHWVEPTTLVNRILAYQENNETIDSHDFAIAISRMPRENTAEALILCERLNKETADLMRYCLGEEKTIKVNNDNFFARLLKTPKSDDWCTLWATAARTYYPDGVFPEFEKTALKDTPNVVKPIIFTTKFKECWSEWRKYSNEIERSPFWWELKVLTEPQIEVVPSNLLYSLGFWKQNVNYFYGYLQKDDVIYWNSIMPQNNATLNIQILQGACDRPTTHELNSQTFKGFLKISEYPEFKFSDASMLIFACVLFNEKKDTRATAAEVLIQKIQNQNIDVLFLGQKIAYLINNNYAPILRLCECFATLKDVSTLHNSALSILLESTIENLELKEKLPTNFKKILEIFYDLKAKMKQKVSEKVISTLKPIAENGTLKSIVKQILALK